MHHEIEARCKSSPTEMTFIDFFSGIGGFRAGLEACGMRCVGHCELDKYADQSYRTIFGVKEDDWFAKDITAVRPEEIPKADIWTAGFPCQDYSDKIVIPIIT